MLINKDWQKQNPVNDILEPYETLLWIGRPNKEIYVRGNRTRRGYMNISIWSLVLLVVSIIGLVFGDGIQKLACATVLVALPIAGYMIFALSDYKLADWYAFSEKRIFLVTCWDAADNDVAVLSTELSNLKEVYITKSRKAPKEAADIGTLVYTIHREIPKLTRKRFVFDLIDHPAEVQTLLVDAKAASRV